MYQECFRTHEINNRFYHNARYVLPKPLNQGEMCAKALCSSSFNQVGDGVIENDEWPGLDLSTMMMCTNRFEQRLAW